MVMATVSTPKSAAIAGSEVAMIVLSLLVILPIAAAVLGDIWAVILGALVGGFALGRATAR